MYFKHLAFVIALAFGAFTTACVESNRPTADPTDTQTSHDSGKADDPTGQPPQDTVTGQDTTTVVQPIETTLEITLQNAITDGDLEITVYKQGDTPEWTTVTEDFFLEITVKLHDVYVVDLCYQDQPCYSQTVPIDKENAVVDIDVATAIPCAKYADVSSYAWACAGTSITWAEDFYVEATNGQCYLKRGEDVWSPEQWDYYGHGDIAFYYCDRSIPACKRNCTGTYAE